MNRILPLVALATVAAMAAPVKFGAEAMVGYNYLSVGSDLTDTKADPGIGFRIGPNASFGLNEMFAITGGVSFQYDMYNTKTTGVEVLGFSVGNTEDNYKSMSIGFQIAPEITLGERFSIKAGYEWDMPLAGTVEHKSLGVTKDKDLVWAPEKESDLGTDNVDLGLVTLKSTNEVPLVSTHNLVAGAAIAVTPNMALTVQGKFALNGLLADYDAAGDFQGSKANASNISLHQLAVGVLVKL